MRSPLTAQGAQDDQPRFTSTLQSDEFLSLVSAGPQEFPSFSVSTDDKHQAEPSLKLPLSSSALRGLAHTGAGFWHHLPFRNQAGMSSLTCWGVVFCGGHCRVAFHLPPPVALLHPLARVVPSSACTAATLQFKGADYLPAVPALPGRSGLIVPPQQTGPGPGHLSGPSKNNSVFHRKAPLCVMVCFRRQLFGNGRLQTSIPHQDWCTHHCPVLWG